MKLNISHLRKDTGAQKDFEFTLNDPADLQDISFVEPIRVNGEIRNTGQLLEMRAQVSTELLASCSRCLDDVRIPINIEFKEKYCHESDWEEMSGLAETDDVILFNDEWLDLAQAVKDNIILELPMRIICMPGCPGICPHCGINLKKGKCECRDEDIDPRLAVLANLKKKGGKS